MLARAEAVQKGITDEICILRAQAEVKKLRIEASHLDETLEVIQQNKIKKEI